MQKLNFIKFGSIEFSILIVQFSETCGYGFRERTRFCEGPGLCPSDIVMLDTESCSIVCTTTTTSTTTTTTTLSATWSEWEEWGLCDASCGGGHRHRHRECEGDRHGHVHIARHGDSDCIGDHEQEAPCNTELCPIENDYLKSCACGGGDFMCLTSTDPTRQCADNERCEKVSMDPAVSHKCVPNTIGKCVSKGDPHVTTTDGKHFDVYGSGTYIMAKSTGDLPEFQVKSSKIVNCKIQLMCSAVSIYLSNFEGL